MNKKYSSWWMSVQWITLGALTALSACSKASKEDLPPPRTTVEAATQLQQVFASAPPEVKTTVAVASEALRTTDYEKAIQSLQTVKSRKNLTMEQGIAVHQSMVALETRLMNAAAAGDANAKRAYELLRKSKRD